VIDATLKIDHDIGQLAKKRYDLIVGGLRPFKEPQQLDNHRAGIHASDTTLHVC
jgi:hypothetical protein